jgi:Ca2+-binding EF-hand superfamily protein
MKTASRLYETLEERGVSGFSDLHQIFKGWDVDGSGRIRARELLAGLMAAGIPVSHGDASELFENIDQDRSGAVSFKEFVQALSPAPSRQRRVLAQHAFETMGGGRALSRGDLLTSFEARYHPDVRMGKISCAKLRVDLQEALQLFAPEVLSLSDFMSFHAMFTAFLSEEEFVEMVSACWRPLEGSSARGFTPTAEEPLDALRNQLRRRGMRSISGLRRRFRLMDANKDGLLSLDELRAAMADMSLYMSDTQAQSLYDLISDGKGSISADDFMHAILQRLPQSRRRVVLQAFQHLDKEATGVLEPHNMVAAMDASSHPMVLEGSRSADEMRREFLETFELGGTIDGKVTLREFETYYAQLSFLVEDDALFDAIVRSAWHMAADDAEILPSKVEHCTTATEQVVAAAGPGGVPPVSRSGNFHQFEATKEPLPVLVVMQQMRSHLRRQNTGGTLNVRAALRRVHAQDDECLTRGELSSVLAELGISLDAQDLRQLFTYLDQDNAGTIPFAAFVACIHPPLSSRRLALVTSAFDLIDSTGCGFVSAEQMAEAFDASRHPDVVSGRLTLAGAFDSFLHSFEMKVPGRVTRSDFEDWCRGLSAMLESDTLFEAWISCFGLSANAPPPRGKVPCRVLATLPDNTQLIQDLMLEAADLEAAQKEAGAEEKLLKEALRQQRGVNARHAFRTLRELESLPIQYSKPSKYSLSRPSASPGVLPGTAADDSSLVKSASRRRRRSHNPNSIPDVGLQGTILRLRTEILEARGAGGMGKGISALIGALTAADSDGDGFLSLKETKAGLNAATSLGATDISAPEIRKLFEFAEEDGFGVGIDHLVSIIRPSMPAARKELAEKVYQRMDKERLGFVRITDIASQFSPSGHPEVLAGRATPDQVLSDFLNVATFPEDGIVTPEDFMDFMANASASIVSDAYWEMLIGWWVFISHAKHYQHDPLHFCIGLQVLAPRAPAASESGEKEDNLMPSSCYTCYDVQTFAKY